MAKGVAGHIVLIGLRGSGKSTVAGLVGARLDRSMVDLDRAVLGEMKCATVSEAWSERGEAAFRAMETRLLRRTLEEADGQAVIALGGGTPTAPGAADVIRAAQAAGRAVVVYLAAGAEVLASRLPEHDPDRPSLTGAGPREEMARVLAERDGFYRDLADHIVDATGEAEGVAVAVCAALGLPT